MLRLQTSTTPRPDGARLDQSPPGILHRSAAFWIAAIAVHRLLLAFALGIAPQEAYYWNYAQHPALGYFDHPPLAAYTILAFTSFLGYSTFVIHLCAIFWSSITLWTLYHISKNLGGRAAGVLALAMWAMTPAAQIGSVVITPDAPLMAFLCLSAWIFLGIVRGHFQTERQLWRWSLLGLFIGLAIMSKYTGAIAAVGVLLYMILTVQGRRWWKHPGPYLATVIMLLTTTPIVIWNSENQWASILFQSGRRANELSGFSFKQLFGFWGSQVATVGPVLFVAAGLAIVSVIFSSWWCRSPDSALPRLDKERQEFALALWAAPLAALITVLAGFYWIKINWPLPSIVLAFPLVASWMAEGWKRGSPEGVQSRARRGWAYATLLSGGILTLLISLLTIFPLLGAGKANTVIGWDTLAARVWEKRVAMGATSTPPVIVGWEYKTASELAYHLRDSISSGEEVLSNEMFGVPGLEYDYWSSPEEFIGRNAIVVRDQRTNNGFPRLTNFFDSVGATDTLKILSHGFPVTEFYVTEAYGYQAGRK